jgi:hypothetical protein
MAYLIKYGATGTGTGEVKASSPVWTHDQIHLAPVRQLLVLSYCYRGEEAPDGDRDILLLI